MGRSEVDQPAPPSPPSAPNSAQSLALAASGEEKFAAALHSPRALRQSEVRPCQKQQPPVPQAQDPSDPVLDAAFPPGLQP